MALSATTLFAVVIFVLVVVGIMLFLLWWMTRACTEIGAVHPHTTAPHDPSSHRTQSASNQASFLSTKHVPNDRGQQKLSNHSHHSHSNTSTATHRKSTAHAVVVVITPNQLQVQTTALTEQDPTRYSFASTTNTDATHPIRLQLSMSTPQQQHQKQLEPPQLQQQQQEPRPTARQHFVDINSGYVPIPLGQKPEWWGRTMSHRFPSEVSDTPPEPRRAKSNKFDSATSHHPKHDVGETDHGDQTQEELDSHREHQQLPHPDLSAHPTSSLIKQLSNLSSSSADNHKRSHNHKMRKSKSNGFDEGNNNNNNSNNARNNSNTSNVLSPASNALMLPLPHNPNTENLRPRSRPQNATVLTMPPVKNLDLLLQNVDGVEKFREFLSVTMCCENLMFWEAVDEVLTNPSIELYNHIFRDFIHDDGDGMVNISGATKTAITEEIEIMNATGEPTAELPFVLRRGQEEIFTLMQTDLLPKFLASPMSSAWRAQWTKQ